MCDVLAIFVYTALPVISILLLMAKGVQGQSVTSLTKSRIHLLLISMLHLAFRIQATLPSLCHRNTASGTAVSHKRKRRESSIDEVDRALLSRLENVQEHQDGEAAFGEHVAACLRQLNPRQRAVARIEIDKVILHLQFPEEPYSTTPQPNDTYSRFYAFS